MDVERVAREAAALARRGLCGDTHVLLLGPGQAMIEEKINELNLNRVIVAACSPSLHELTFRRTWRGRA